MYAVWCTGEHEFYDLKKDPYELKNLYSKANVQLVNRLDALLLVLKSCRAETCRDPWRVLHPHDKSVKTLEDALHKKYDAHYNQFKKVEYEECLPFYEASNEQPKIGNHFKSNVTRPRPRPHAEQTDQHVINVIKKRADKSNEDGKFILPKQYHDLFKLVPESSEAVGHAVPDLDFEKHAVPVDQSLLDDPVNWSQYNFYGFGN